MSLISRIKDRSLTFSGQWLISFFPSLFTVVLVLVLDIVIYYSAVANMFLKSLYENFGMRTLDKAVEK